MSLFSDILFMNILQQIFSDNYEIIQYTLHPRDVELENISKMIHCGDPAYGGAMYACSKCGHFKFVPFRCHSRFCPTCGVKYSKQRSSSMSFKLISCSHRHCVFTIDEELRPLEWNPHIHCLISEGGLSDDGFWRTIKHFNFRYMRNAFQTALLNEMERKIGPSFKKTKAKIYHKDKNGFYVYAKPNLCDPDTVVKYISRYLGRPVIALSRIESYDGESVTFHYNRHEDNVFVKKTLPAIDFIKLLIQHIPEKNFKMTRYYGLYARHRISDQKLRKAIHPSKHKFLKSFSKWRDDIALSFDYDPLKCPHCHQDMCLLEIYHNHQRVSLEELYERAMARARCRSA